MDRVYQSGAVQTPPAVPPSAGGYPTAGNAATGTPSTVPGPYWFHAITEELRNCVVNSGQTPDGSALDQLWQAMIRAAHPVGSIYQSTDPTSPETLFGGTWVQIKDRVLIAAGGSYGVLTTGGSSTHTLTVDEMPAHNHAASTAGAGKHSHTRGSMEIEGSLSTSGGNASSWTPSGAFYKTDLANGGAGPSATSSSRTRLDFKASKNWTGSSSEQADHTHTVTVNSKGGGKAFSTMDPYIAVYMWRRTA